MIRPHRRQRATSFAAWLPAKTPPAVVARRRELLATGRKSVSAKSFCESTGTDAWTTASSEELARLQAAEAQKWGKVPKAAGIEPE